jgi:hypothetical protein
VPQLILLDVAPDLSRVGALFVVVLLIIGFILLLAAGLVVFLWYRKRSLRGVEMIRPETLPTGPAQLNKPNQS